MGKIVSICNLKGGAGKTTTAINIAVYMARKGVSVCIVDADIQQQSATVWSANRPDDVDRVHVFPVSSIAFSKKVESYAKEYDVVIIDAPPHTHDVTTMTIGISDLLIVPVKPSPLDLWAFQQFLERIDTIIEEIGEELPVYGILTEYNSSEKRPIKLDIQFLEVFKESDIPILAKIKKRQAHKTAIAYGLGSIEYKDKKARKEMEQLGKEIMKIINKIK